MAEKKKKTEIDVAALEAQDKRRRQLVTRIFAQLVAAGVEREPELMSAELDDGTEWLGGGLDYEEQLKRVRRRLIGVGIYGDLANQTDAEIDAKIIEIITKDRTEKDRKNRKDVEQAERHQEMVQARADAKTAKVPPIRHKPKTVPIDGIVVGTRHRRDLGDIDALAASIREVGLLCPIAVTPDSRLIAGQRRLAAIRQLGWPDVPVQVIGSAADALMALRMERDENVCRKDFALSEAVAIGREIEELEREEARRRQAQAGPKQGKGRKKTAPGKFPEAVADRGRVRDRVGEVVGLSGRTYEKAKVVVEAAERDPARYAHYVEEMDRTGKVNRPYQELTQRRAAGSATPTRETSEAPNADVVDFRTRVDAAQRAGRALTGVSLATITAAADRNEVGQWASRLEDVAGMLRTVASQLRKAHQAAEEADNS